MPTNANKRETKKRYATGEVVYYYDSNGYCVSRKRGATFALIRLARRAALTNGKGA